jgi:endonuclease VIII
MPEGDTLHRTAAGLRPHLLGRRVLAARGRVPGPRLGVLVGAEVTGVDSRGKNLLVRFSNGLELRTHLGMRGTWHRYPPATPWRRPPGRASVVLEVDGSVAVCFDASAAELLEIRAEALYPPLAGLGPDLLSEDFEPAAAIRRLCDPARSDRPIAEALLDQRALAGIGNVIKSEALFLERVDPFATVASLDDATLLRLIERARSLLLANLGGGPRVTTTAELARAGRRSWVYGRAGRPCPRCRAPIAVRRHGELPRTTYWCPRCQGDGR